MELLEISKELAENYYSTKLINVYIRAIPTTKRTNPRELQHLINRGDTFIGAIISYRFNVKARSRHKIQFYIYKD